MLLQITTSLKNLSQINITLEDGQQFFVTDVITILRYLDLKQQKKKK